MVKPIVCFLCYLTIFFRVCFGNQPLEPQLESVIRLSGENVKNNKIIFAKIRSNHKKKHFHTSKCMNMGIFSNGQNLFIIGRYMKDTDT